MWYEHSTKKDVNTHTFLDFQRSPKEARSYFTVPNCKYCYRSFHDFDLYKRHIRRHERCYQLFWRLGSQINSEIHCQSVDENGTYICKYCHKQFTHMWLLNEHEANHPYQCSFCLTCFESTAAFIGHKHSLFVKSVSKSSTLPTVGMPVGASVHQHEEADLLGANDCYEEEAVWLCKFCRKAFVSLIFLHEHNTSYPIFCSGCQTCLATVTEYFSHQKIHKRNAHHSGCNICWYCHCKLDSEEQALNHVCFATRTFPKPRTVGSMKYECKQCMYCFPDSDHLLHHLCPEIKSQKNDHTEKSTPVIKHMRKRGRANKTDQDIKTTRPTRPTTESKTKRGRPRQTHLYRCKQCPRYFSSIKKMVWHECNSTVQIPKKHKCTLCYMFFEFETDLLSHIKIDHECKHCQMQFKTNHQMMIHLRRIHRHQCPHCKQILVDQTELFQHVKSDHLCRHCPPGRPDRFLPTKQELIEHEKTHGFICEYCRAAFVTHHTLTWHIKKEHASLYRPEVVCLYPNTPKHSNDASKTILKPDTNVEPPDKIQPQTIINTEVKKSKSWVHTWTSGSKRSPYMQWRKKTVLSTETEGAQKEKGEVGEGEV